MSVEKMLKYSKENGLKVGVILEEIPKLWTGSNLPVFKENELVLYLPEKNKYNPLENLNKLTIWKFEPSIGKTIGIKGVSKEYVKKYISNCKITHY